jgi:hypothetical protein
MAIYMGIPNYLKLEELKAALSKYGPFHCTFPQGIAREERLKPDIYYNSMPSFREYPSS